MEDRTLLASFLVTTAADNGDNTNPVPGSLRQAILSSNSVTGPNTIDFNIPADSVAEFPVPTAGSVPVGITSGPDGALWFVERSGNKVARMTTLGAVTAEYSIPTADSQPILITSGPDGDLWFTENAGNKIGRLAPTTIVTSSPETVPDGATVTPFGGGTVYTAGSTIPAGTYLPAGTITEYTVPTPNSGPWGIAQGPDGAMWFTENVHKLGRIDPATGAITEFALPSGSLNVGGLTTGPDGNLWYADLNGFIGRVTTAGVVTTFATSVADSQPYTVKVGPDGALWFPERTGKIGRITASDATTTADTVVPADAVTYTPDGTVYPAGSTIPTGTLLPAGTMTEYTVPASGSQPIDLTVGADGALWFTEFLGASKIGRLTPDGTFTEFGVPTGGTAPAGITEGPDSNIWFTEYLGGKVGRLGGPVTILPTAPLPAITQLVTIDGTTQPGYAGTPLVMLDGAAAGPGAVGLTISVGDSTVQGLVINNFAGNGLALYPNGGNTIRRNYIGTDSTGTIAQPNGSGILIEGPDNTIGGTAPGAGNLVSGNNGYGIAFYTGSDAATGNLIEGNRIGTDATGTAALPNADGIFLEASGNTIGGTAAGAGNLISGNLYYGLDLLDSNAVGNMVQGNLIGTDVTGAGPLGNGASGIEIQAGAQSNQVGGPGPAGNTIAYNNTEAIAGYGGVVVRDSTSIGNAIRGNSIHDNTGLGIDLGGDGVTLNGSHAGQAGPNNWQAFPVITSAIGGSVTQVAGSLTGTPGATYTLDLYANADADPSGYGQGTIYLGSGSVTIDSTGSAAFAVTVPGSTMPGELITATATDSSGDTSEFSLDVPISFNLVVTTTADSGPGSLRQAILDVNAGGGGDTIDFNIPFDPVNPFSITRTIYLASPLPPITEPVTIDGYTQSAAQPNTLTVGNNAALMIYVDGTSAGSSADGLTLDARGIAVRGLVIDNFSGNGIVIDSSGDTVVGDHLGGTMVGSTVSNTNGGDGVYVEGSDNTIGGTAPAASNVISANGRQLGLGFDIDILATGNLVEGNLIGTNAAGAKSAGDSSGIDIEASGNTIGGATAGAGNLISGNYASGIDVGASGNLVEGNRIGTDATGTVALPNQDGITVSVPGNTIGGTASGAGNLISGNSVGVWIFAPGAPIPGSGGMDNLLEGNLIGTDAAGNSPVGNNYGVFIENAGNTVGGTAPGAANVISGNLYAGIVIGASGSLSLVEGNHIGTNADGTVSLNNGSDDGIELYGPNNTIGGTTAGAGNLISGNGYGIVVDSPGNLVEGNLIGTDATGSGPLGNYDGGVGVQASNNTIGGTTAGAGNTIAFNNPFSIPFQAGVVVTGSTAVDNSIRGNSIHDNGGLGIDLGDDGVTLNGSHAGQAGPNDWQTYPILTSITSSGGSTTINGMFSSTPNTTYALDFYANATDDPTGFGQGQTPIDTIGVTTDSAGNAALTAVLSVGVPTGQYVSATATNLVTGDTSEFSPSVGVNTDQVPVAAVNLTTIGTALQAAVSALQSVAPSTTPPVPSITLVVDPSTLSSVASAIGGLTADPSADSNPVPIVLDLAAGTYSDTVISAPAGVAVTINGGGGAVIVGNSPALEVDSGSVLVEDLTLTTATDSPTILVTGGSLIVRSSTVEGTPTYAQPAILITGGSLDLGTTSSPGGNTINVNAGAEPVQDTSSGAVSDFGDTYQVSGTPLSSPDLSFTTLSSSAVSSAYGQSVTLTAAVRAANSADGTPTGSVDFVDATTGTDLGTIPVSSGIARLTTAALAVGSHAITARYLGDSHFAFSLDTLAQTVTPQTAVSATYTGLLYIATASATTSTAAVTLSTTIKDFSGGAGTITNATVTFVNQADGSTIAGNLPISLINSTDPTTGTASYNWSVDIGSASSQSYTIGIIVGGDYARNRSADDAVVTVSKPQAGSATGGGYLVNQNSAGLVPGDAGAHTNFGFNAKNNSGGVQGQANIIVRYQGHVYQFQSTSITSLTFPTGNTADYAATGTIQDVTDSSRPVTLYTGAALQVTMTDNGSGASDTIGITILTPGGALWFSSDWNGTSTVEQSLGGGNLQVRPAQELAGAPAAGTAAVAPLALNEIGPIAAEAVALWAAAGIDPRQLSVLSHTTFRIDDLTGSDLAWERQGVITLDRTADGYGWFIDPTPGDSSEFAPGAVNSPTNGHVDLLSVVAHELGHLLGYGEDDSAGVTGEYLPVGVRHVPIAIQAAGEAPGPLSTASTPVSPQTSVLLGTTTASEPLIVLDAVLAGWSSSHRELATQQVLAPMTASSVSLRDGTASIVPPVQVWPGRLIIDPGSADAVIGSGSIASLLGADLTGRPTRNGKPSAFRIPS